MMGWVGLVLEHVMRVCWACGIGNFIHSCHEGPRDEAMDPWFVVRGKEL